MVVASSQTVVIMRSYPILWLALTLGVSCRSPVSFPVGPSDLASLGAQGVFGCVLDVNGAPVAGAKIFLFAENERNVFKHLWLHNRGYVDRPVAGTETTDSGVFRLPVSLEGLPSSYELRVVSDTCADQVVAKISVSKGLWRDLEDLELEAGHSVRGRVTEQSATRRPIAGALVSIRRITKLPTLSPTPGRESGRWAVTDAEGWFQVDYVGSGAQVVTAIAAGYSQAVHWGDPDAGLAAEVDLQLKPGHTLNGFVRDHEGSPLADARIEVVAEGGGFETCIRTRSHEDGHFTVIGLGDGRARLHFSADGYVGRNLPVVDGAMEGEAVTLNPRGAARVSVLSPRGELVSEFELEVKVTGEGGYFTLFDFGTTVVRATDLEGGVFTLPGFAPGQYQFVLRAEGGVETISSAFTIVPGGESPQVEVQMRVGGAFEGVVTGEDGAPMAGVRVSTSPVFDKNPFEIVCFGPLPKWSRRQARTDANGRYRLEVLRPRTYRLRFELPGHDAVYGAELECVDGKTTAVERVTMKHE